MHTSNNASARLYLNLLRHSLCRDRFPDSRYDISSGSLQLKPFDPELREKGRDWPLEAVTMVGTKRLENLENCCCAAVQEKIPGDFVETGVWRGGCGILMRGVLAATGDQTRQVWLFDSFEGLPQPDAKNYPHDEGDRLWTFNEYLAVSLEKVKANFERFDLLDQRTQFVAGWFRDTIPKTRLNSISVLRLDGDLYESTRLVLSHLYSRVSSRGFIIIDDYALPNCKAAVDDFRATHSIQSPMTRIDWSGMFWRK